MNAVDIARALFDAYNRADMRVVSELYQDDAVHIEMASNSSKCGPDAIRGGLQYFINAFPNSTWRVRDLMGDATRASVVYELTGTLTRQLGPLTPQGQRLSLRGVMVLHTSDAQISRSEDYWDSTTFANQMAVTAEEDAGGVAGEPATSATATNAAEHKRG